MDLIKDGNGCLAVTHFFECLLHGAIELRTCSSEGLSMEYCQKRNFMFCEMCGTMLSFSSVKYAHCPLCETKRSTKELVGKQTSYILTAENMRRELKTEEPFIKLNSLNMDDGGATNRPIAAEETCRNCGHVGLEYATLQMRSADEGQTVFYTCTKCGHKRTEN